MIFSRYGASVDRELATTPPQGLCLFANQAGLYAEALEPGFEPNW